MKNTIYIPLTETPFKKNETYQEVFPRNPGLAKYIRCFRGSTQPYLKKEKDISGSIVIPDTCVDILYHIDYTENTIAGKFCAVNDASFIKYENTAPGHLISVLE